MAADFGNRVVIAAAVLSLAAAVLCNGFPKILTLERSFSLNHGVNLTQLMARDMTRHRRMLSSTTGVVDFPVYGTYDPFLVGLYYTRVQLGDPPKDFYVQIDSGSDALWVSCSSCTGCPMKSDLHVPMNFFNPATSSTASTVSCSDPICMEGIQSADARCSALNNECGYYFLYGDGNTSSGNYVSDTLYLDIFDQGSSSFRNSSAQVVFGCSTEVTGELTKKSGAVDGIFGFGQSSISVISQLASQGITPHAFSHCLNGGRSGGGILVLGEIVEPDMVYSPIVPGQAHYNLNLESISVDGKALSINASVFETTNNGGTIIDSGTTLAYLADGAYMPFIIAIDAIAVSNSAQQIPIKSNYCYLTNSTSSSDVFPQVSFHFEGATMTIGPEDYLLQQETTSGTMLWCIGIGPMQGGMTILGDIVLQNKIVVYNLAEQKIGWTNYNCSMPVNVATTTNTGENATVSIEHSNTTTSSNSRTVPNKLTLWTVMLSLAFDLVVGHFMFQ